MEQNLAVIFGITPISVQLLLLAVSFAMGALIICLYTAYSWIIDRTLGEKGFKRSFVFSVSDIFFWIVMALLAFRLYYLIDNAAIRLFYFIFILCGMLTAYNIKLRIIKHKKGL